jgi:hypothetical protein
VRLLAHQSARLAAACPVAADAFAAGVFRQGVLRAVVPGRGHEHAMDAKAVVAQDATHRERPEPQAQRDVLPGVPLEQSSLRVQVQRVLLLEPQARESQRAVPPLAQVSQLQVPERVVSEEQLLPVPGPRALPPLADASQRGE